MLYTSIPRAADTTLMTGFVNNVTNIVTIHKFCGRTSYTSMHPGLSF